MTTGKEQPSDDSTDSSNSKDDLTLWDFSPTLFWQQVGSDPQSKGSSCSGSQCSLPPEENVQSIAPKVKGVADTSISLQEDPVIPEVPVAVVAPGGTPFAAAVTGVMIEQHQDEAEEILLNVEVLLMSTSRVPVSSKMASMFSKKVEDATTALTKCHVYLKRRDKENHAADLGPRIETTILKLADLFLKLTSMQYEEPSELAAQAVPAGTHTVDLRSGGWEDATPTHLRMPTHDQRSGGREDATPTHLRLPTLDQRSGGHEDAAPTHLRPAVVNFDQDKSDGSVSKSVEIEIAEPCQFVKFVKRREGLESLALDESKHCQVGSSAYLLSQLPSPSWDDFECQMLNDMTAVQDCSAIAQNGEFSAQAKEDLLSAVPKGGERAETNPEKQEKVVVPAALPVKDSTAVSAAVDMIEQRQDEAEELLISIDVNLMSIARSVTSPKMAGQYSKEVKEFTRALTKCHVYLKRHDKENHAVDLGPRIEETLANLRELQLRLLHIQQEALEEPGVPAAATAPAGPPQADQKDGDSTQQAVAMITAKLEEILAEAKKIKKLKPSDDDEKNLWKAVSTYRQSLELACTKLEKGKNQEERLFTAPTVPITQELVASIVPGAAPVIGRCTVEWPFRETCCFFDIVFLRVKYNLDLLPFGTLLCFDGEVGQLHDLAVEAWEAPRVGIG
jgi:hypothetical protein